MKLLLLSAATLALAATGGVVTFAQKYTYEFDAALAAGVVGAIQVEYLNPNDPTCTKARISAALDFSGVDMAAIRKADGNCTADVTTYKWHIHVKWPTPENTSASFAQCSKALTGNHFDPLHACGPNSEFAEDKICAPRIQTYKCTPETYAKDPKACEKGDLGGKFGDFALDEDQRVAGEWVDDHYPLKSENTPEWNMILHAVCGKATPRIACAVAQAESAGDDDENSDEGDDYESNEEGDDYASNEGGDDYETNEGGDDYESNEGGDDYATNEDDDYESESAAGDYPGGEGSDDDYATSSGSSSKCSSDE